jgi:hypothetical protein
MSPTPVAPTGAVVAARTAPPPASPTPSTVLMLQAVRAYPCVSVLVTTTPSERMTSRDAERLRELVADAEDRLRTAGLMRARATGAASPRPAPRGGRRRADVHGRRPVLRGGGGPGRAPATAGARPGRRRRHVRHT